MLPIAVDYVNEKTLLTIIIVCVIALVLYFIYRIACFFIILGAYHCAFYGDDVIYVWLKYRLLEEHFILSEIEQVPEDILKTVGEERIKEWLRESSRTTRRRAIIDYMDIVKNKKKV